MSGVGFWSLTLNVFSTSKHVIFYNCRPGAPGAPAPGGPGGPGGPPVPAQQSKRLQQTQAQVDEVSNHFCCMCLCLACNKLIGLRWRPRLAQWHVH